jgi:hypothetical protein
VIWFKMHTDVMDDVRLRRLAPRRFRTWVMLCAACADADKTREATGIVPGPLEDIAWRLRIPLRTLERDLAELERHGLICRSSDGGVSINGWRERQCGSSTARVQRHRQRKKNEKRLGEVVGELAAVKRI